MPRKVTQTPKAQTSAEKKPQGAASKFPETRVPSQPIVQLQHTIGNQGVRRLLAAAQRTSLIQRAGPPGAAPAPQPPSWLEGISAKHVQGNIWEIELTGYGRTLVGPYDELTQHLKTEGLGEDAHHIVGEEHLGDIPTGFTEANAPSVAFEKGTHGVVSERITGEQRILGGRHGGRPDVTREELAELYRQVYTKDTKFKELAKISEKILKPKSKTGGGSAEPGPAPEGGKPPAAERSFFEEAPVRGGRFSRGTGAAEAALPAEGVLPGEAMAGVRRFGGRGIAIEGIAEGPEGAPHEPLSFEPHGVPVLDVIAIALEHVEAERKRLQQEALEPFDKDLKSLGPFINKKIKALAPKIEALRATEPTAPIYANIRITVTYQSLPIRRIGGIEYPDPESEDADLRYETMGVYDVSVSTKNITSVSQGKSIPLGPRELHGQKPDMYSSKRGESLPEYVALTGRLHIHYTYSVDLKVSPTSFIEPWPGPEQLPENYYFEKWQAPPLEEWPKLRVKTAGAPLIPRKGGGNIALPIGTELLHLGESKGPPPFVIVQVVGSGVVGFIQPGFLEQPRKKPTK